MDFNKNTIPSVVPPPTGTSHDDPIQSHAAALSAAGGQQSSDMRVLTESALHEADVTAPAPALMPKRSKKSKKAKNMSKEAQFEALSLHSVEVAPETFETRGEFSTEICDCFVGRGAEAICCTAFLFPCWAHGIIGDAVTEGSGRCSPCMFTCGLYAIYTAGAALVVKGPVAAALMCAPMTVMFGLNVRGRTRMREKYGVRGECCPNDFCSMFLCTPCSLAQEMRHIRDTMPPGRRLQICADAEYEYSDQGFFQRALSPYC